MGKITLTKLSQDELIEYIESLGEKKFRANQIFSWIWAKNASSFDDMTDVKKEFRALLQEKCQIFDCKIKTRQISADSTVKYLIEFSDGLCAETVLMRFDNRANLSMCVSSQIGCKMGCIFCATGKNGFKRNLLPHEIASQILLAQIDTGLKITNVVFMGQGEPLDNLENVKGALELINKNLQISIRRMTLSTSGIVPKINELSENNLIPTLAISLHAPNHQIREKIMPVEKKYNINELKKALLNYSSKTKDRVTIEYILIKNLNDSKECAKELIEYLKDLKCNINLIPYNSIDSQFQKPDKKTIMKFKYLLEESGKKVTVRLERGADIDAACGQLAGKIQ
ncbi:MAG: 23S rRNA (adenine(2503)-C(2))-methyltransferase RlmN [Candidatus Gastranaerophilales bacterium]|nr:23S rRNA (adenine(2503)-C(2))-methyltransferase RlmN [Candidatus Gastranaerophilales bacterium]